MDGIYIALFKPRESMIGSAEELFTAFCSYAKAHGGKVG